MEEISHKKILQDISSIYGDFILKIWKTRSQMYPGIFNFRAIVGKNHFIIQEVTFIQYIFI